jgi:O-antigen/teichoic acid export membrane protein
MRFLPTFYRTALASTGLRVASVGLGLLVLLVAARAVSAADFGRFGLMIAVQFALAAIVTRGFQRGALRYVPQFKAQARPEQIDLMFRDAIAATAAVAGSVLVALLVGLYALWSFDVEMLFNFREVLLIYFICVAFALNLLFCHFLRGLGSVQGALFYQDVGWRALFVPTVVLL